MRPGGGLGGGCGDIIRAVQRAAPGRPQQVRTPWRSTGRSLRAGRTLLRLLLGQRLHHAPDLQRGSRRAARTPRVARRRAAGASTAPPLAGRLPCDRAAIATILRHRSHPGALGLRGKPRPAVAGSQTSLPSRVRCPTTCSMRGPYRSSSERVDRAAGARHWRHRARMAVVPFASRPLGCKPVLVVLTFSKRASKRASS